MPVAYDAARNMIGGGARALIVRGLKAEGRTLDVIEIDRMVSDFIDHYAAHIADQSRPFPDLDPHWTRSSRVAAGWRSAPTSSNGWQYASSTHWRSPNGSPPSAEETRSGCRTEPGNPSAHDRARRRGHGLDRHGGRLLTDIATARAAGVPVVAVDYGYTERPVAEMGADRVIGTLSALPGAVFDLLRTRRATPAARR